MDAKDELLLKAKNVFVKRSGKWIIDDISFTLQKGDHLAIAGESGSGKTTLALALAGKLFFKGEIHYEPVAQDRILFIEQQHHFKSLSNTTDLYYQQRFNSYDSEETQTVYDSLEGNDENIATVLQRMKIDHLKDKPLIQLSNGENKKLQIAKALLLQPSVLIMDQPFTGLDAATRKFLHELINDLAERGVAIIVITSGEEIPAYITKVLLLKNGKLQSFGSRVVFWENYLEQRSPVSLVIRNKEKLEKKLLDNAEDFEYAIRMKEVNVQYNKIQILQHINWDVKKGERWLLSGPNGAGKSTLLSLVTGDNPQAYANEVYLFDKKRGSGESIWDIKRKIGFLSPELHLFFEQDCTCFEAIASGLYDTIGLFRQLSQADMQTVYDWAEIGGVEELLQKRLFELSLGQQRIILLIRALVKNPPLLILDEPCQGIDSDRQSQLLDLINTVCLQGNKTMVFVTHYAHERPACIDHFLQIEDGIVVKSTKS